MIWRCDGRDKSNAFNRALFGYFFKRELLKSFNSLFSQVWRSTKSFQHFVCDCWFYSFYLFFFVPSSKLFPYLVHLIRCSFSSPTFLLGPLSMKAERTELMRPVEPSLQRSIPPPPVLGDGKFSVTGIGRDSRCAPWWMSRRPAPLYIYIYIVDLVYIYIHCDACACTFTPASSSTLELLISNVIMNHVSLFSFSSQQLRNVFLFSSFGTWFVFSRSSVSSSW